jgi:hypothetical protein
VEWNSAFRLVTVYIFINLEEEKSTYNIAASLIKQESRNLNTPSLNKLSGINSTRFKQKELLTLLFLPSKL